PLSPRLARLRSLTSLVRGAPLTQGYFGDAHFRAGVDRIIARHRPSLFYVFSSAMAPYIAHHHGARVIVDMVDVVSERWRQYVEAITWFVGQVLPRLLTHPTAPCLWIVGSKPSRAVRALAGPDVRVTGWVPDVRPYLSHARVVVAPLQIARGIQNKVLEAMAMGAAVVVTPQAREGLDRCRDDELLTAATPAAFADAVSRILGGEAGQVGARAR